MRNQHEMRARLVKGSVALGGALLAGALLLAAPAAEAATLTVTNTSGDPLVVDSLPNLVAAASDGDEIIFDALLSGTITLDSTLAIANKSLTITGPGSGTIALTTASGPVVQITNATATTRTPSISGLEIENSTGAAITSSGRLQLTVDSMLFTANQSGIEMSGVSSGTELEALSVSNSQFVDTVGRAVDVAAGLAQAVDDVDITNVTITDPGGVSTSDGVSIEDVIDVSIVDTAVSGQAGDGVRLFVGANGTDPETVTLTNLDSTGNDEGLYVESVNGPIVVNGGSDLSNNVKWGALIQASGADVTVADTTASDNGDTGLRLQSAAVVDVDDVIASGNTGNGASISGVTGPVTVDGSTMNANSFGPASGDGISLTNVTGTTVLTGNTTSDNGRNGVRAQPATATPGALMITGDPVTADSFANGNGSFGISANGSSSFEVSHTNVDTNLGGITANNTGPVTIDSVTAQGSTGSTGVSISGATGSVDVTGSTVDGGASTGVVVTPNGSPNPTTDVTIDGTSADDNTGDGMQLSGSGTVTVRNGSTASDNGGSGAVFGEGTVVVDGATLDGNGGDGLFADGSADVTVTATGADGNAQAGFDLENHTGTATISGGSIEGNGTHGVQAGVSAALSGSVEVSGVDLTDNPVGIEARGSSVVTVTGPLSITGHTGPAIDVGQRGAVTIDDVTIDNDPLASGPVGDGIVLVTVDSVTITDTTVADQVGGILSIAAQIEGVAGDVDITGSDVSGETDFGFVINDVDGATTIDTSMANGHGRSGISLQNTGAVSMTGTTTDGNGEAGLSGSSLDSLSLTDHSADVTVDGPGVNVSTITGPVTIAGGTFDGSLTTNVGHQGLALNGVTGPTELDGVSVNDNSGDGISLGSMASVVIDGGSAVGGNAGDGISIFGATQVAVVDSESSDNGASGLRVSTTTGVSISGSTFDRNGDQPTEHGVDATDIDGEVDVNDSFFRSNAGDGLRVLDAASTVTLDSSTLSLNVGNGAAVGSIGTSVGDVTSNGSSFADNGGIGLDIENASDVVLTGVTIDGNARDDGPAGEAAARSTGAGLEVSNSGDLTVVNTQITDNSGLLPPVPPATVAAPGGPAVRLASVGNVAWNGGSVSTNNASGIQIIGAAAMSVVDTTFADNDGAAGFVNTPTTVAIDGVTVSGHDGDGWSINAPSGAVSVIDSAFSEQGGRAVAVSQSASSDVSIVDSVFNDNQVALGLDQVGGDLTISGSAFSSNNTAYTGADVGGLAVGDSEFTANITGIRLADVDGDIDLSTTTFADHSGKAIDVSDVTGDASLTEVAVSGGNQPSLFDTVSGSLVVDRSSFVENNVQVGAPQSERSLVDTVSGVVGAIDVGGGVDIVNTTLSGNGSAGPVVDVEGTALSIRHSTIFDNAGFVQVRSDGAISVDHSVVVGRGSAQSFAAGDVSVTFSFLPSGTGIVGNIEGDDPLLAPLALNGGTTPSLVPLEGSPLVNAGDPSITGAPAIDQTGGQRIRDVIDIGAVESDPVVDPPSPPAPLAALLEPLEPSRFADTRPNGETFDGQFEADGKLAAGEEYRVQIAGRGDVPVGAVGAVVNITAVNAEATGFVTAHPCVEPRPLASSLNYTAGVNLGNEVVAGLSSSGEICLFVSDPTELTVDVTGFVPAGSEYVPLTPQRFMDTRPGQTTFDDIGDDGERLAAGSNTILLMSSRGEVPRVSEGLSAVVVNVTAIGAEEAGFVTIHPCVDPPPLASSLNYVAGVNRGNEIVAPVDPGGRICIFTSASIHLTVDIVGYVPADTDLTPVEPARLLETRDGQATVDGVSAGGGKVAAGDSVTLQVTGRHGIPDGATAAIVNVTAIGPEAAGFLTVHPCLDPPPLASSLNYVPGVNGGNEIVASLDDEGRLCVFTSATTHLAVDVVGFLS